MLRSLYIALLVVAAVFSSCVRKDLKLENNIVDLTLSVDDGRGDGSIYRGLVWDLSTDAMKTTLFVRPGRSQATIPSGHSGFIVHTYGCESTYIAGDNAFGEVRATTNPADAGTRDLWQSVLGAEAVLSPVERERLATQDVRWEPDRMWAGLFEGVLPRRGQDESLEMEIVAEPLFSEHKAILRNVEGMEYIASAEAFITGCAQARRVCDGSPVGTCVILVKAFRYEDGLLVSWTSFGESDSPLALKRLLLMVTDTGGRRFLASYDITDAFADGDVMERASGLVFERPPVTDAGGGLQPTLQDWDEVVTPVNI